MQSKKPAFGLCYLLTACAVLLLSFSVFPIQSPAEEKKTGKEPIVITAKTLTADNKAKTALFEGTVEARRGEMTLFADRMLVHYTDEKDAAAIRQIDASGKVKLIRGDRIVTSDHAVYRNDPEEHVVFTGSPRAVGGENVVTGTKMVYYFKEDRSVVENSRVMIVDRDKRL